VTLSPPTRPSPSGVILSAGLGTRMRPLSLERPKPLLPLCGRPLLEWGLEALRELGVRDVGVNTYYLAEQVSQALTHRPERLYWSHERELQGTGGGIRDLCALLPIGEVIAINGDAFFDFSLAPLLDAHREMEAVATLALRPVEPGDPFGRVGVDAHGRVVRIAEVTGPLSHTEVRVGAFTGAQVLTPTVCAHLPEGPCDVFRTAHRALLAQEAPIYAHFVPRDSLWVDVGTPARYLQAHRALFERPQSALWRRIPPHERRGSAIVFEGATLDPSVQVHGPCWIGQGAHIEPRSTVGECVLWPQVHWRAQLDLPRGVLTQERAYPIELE
jgi:NDP-sugar pyrophosphorylase family protein